MRVLILTQYFAPEVGAAQARILFLARYLKEHGHEVVVVTTPPSYPGDQIYCGHRNTFLQREQLDEISIFRTWVFLSKRRNTISRLANFLSFPFSCLAALLAAGRVDVILVETPPIFLAFSAWLYGFVKRAPVVVQYSDLWVKAAIQFGYIPQGWPARLALWIENTALNRGVSVVAATEGLVSDLLQRGFPLARVRLITNGVNCRLYQPGPGTETLRSEIGLNGKFVVMVAGTLSHQAGLKVVLDAADLLRQDEGVSFVIVGDGVERRPMQEAASAMSLPNIIFSGPQSDEMMPEYLRLADVALNTLSSDPVTDHTLSVKLFAYLACGLPVICTDRREVRKLITAAQAGILVSPENPQAIVNAIQDLRRDPQVRKVMGERGRQFVVQFFDRRVKAEEMLHLLSEAAGRKLGELGAVCEGPSLSNESIGKAP